MESPSGSVAVSKCVATVDAASSLTVWVAVPVISGLSFTVVTLTCT